MATIEEAWERLGKQLAWGIREGNYVKSPAGWLRLELDAEYAAGRELAMAGVEESFSYDARHNHSKVTVGCCAYHDLRARIEALDKRPA